MGRVRAVYLPPGPQGAKVGLDDFLATGATVRSLIALAEDQLRPAPAFTDAPRPAPYEATPQGFVWIRETGPVPLTNFVAEIVGDVAEDDGAETRHIFEIEARLGPQVRRFHIGAEQFSAMNWPTAQLGAHAILYPGFGLPDHARAAIQFTSLNIQEKRIYTHTGWRERDHAWLYLHAGGAIGSVGVVQGVDVRLSDALTRFELPRPPAGEELVRAIRASLDLLDVGPDHVTLVSYAAMARAALGSADFSLHIAGQTGAGKTALAALLQQHYGAGHDAAHVPASWSSTGNALEGLAFQVKDALLLVDDFAPTGSQGDVQRLHREADRLLRAQGNNSGRQRMRPDGTLRPPKPPRGLIMSTGEDVPRGQSLRARVITVDLKLDDLDWPRVTTCQTAASEGLYAEALAGFVQWLAGRYDQVRRDLRREMAAWRDRASGAAATHRRLPTIIAHLLVGLDYWLQYACDAGAVTRQEMVALWERGQVALEQAAAAQTQHQHASEPTERFLEFLRAAIASGRAHVANIAGGQPERAEAWGWSPDVTDNTLVPRGERIGWLSQNDDLYLEPEASYAVVQRFARDGGESITVGSKTLHKRFHERGMLVETDARRGKLTIRKVLQKQRRAVLHLKASLVAPPAGAQQAHRWP